MQKKWYRLDTAALIVPAIARRDWSNAFRVSVSLTEPVDPEVLQRAANDLRARFPSFFRDAAQGRLLVLPRGEPEARRGARGLRLSADLHEQPAASPELPAHPLL